MLHAELVRDLAGEDVRRFVAADGEQGVRIFRPGPLQNFDAGTAAFDGHGVELVGYAGDFVRVVFDDHDVVILFAEGGCQKAAEFARPHHDDFHGSLLSARMP